MNDAGVRFDAAILIGRFQPFHNGHAALLKQALEMADRALVVLGSSFRARNAKNPFTWEERAAMIAASVDEAEARRILFVPVRDYYNDARWAAAVEEAVRTAMEKQGLAAPRIALAGFHKDASSDYLKLFPQWSFAASKRQGDFDATPIRGLYFGSNEAAWVTLRAQLPPAVAQCLEDWRLLPAFAAMREEYESIVAGQQEWGLGPFVTLDAVVTVAGQVLLVRRKHPPGKGLWAIPGGFLEGRERLLQGAIRELKEETGLAVAGDDLAAACRSVAVFDHPDRSQRGRVITHAYWFDLPLSTLPPVTGADDAAEARWFPITGLPDMEKELFEDHFVILEQFLGGFWSVCP
ncbi:MAG: bifunctional nicotinamide-nucleotide adenylyltransferase/Nudix hydroxylase [Proteobacteria bacterium]|jgi:bifunctional NMN adenylyltransferase/nudix hydrolase|nr:bifunctional nicotinamide-nucleotide adenylyltransferase/Nudix hydroxylase [Pseudomonadota bacterium]